MLLDERIQAQLGRGDPGDRLRRPGDGDAIASAPEREEIIVESVKQVPDELERDEEKPGLCSWTLELIPKQKQELTLSYRVRHPVDMQIH